MTLLLLTLLWATAAGTLWLHAVLGIPGDYLGQGYPLSPGLRVTLGSLAFDAAAATLPIPLVAAVTRRLGFRWTGVLALVLFWLWAASALIWPFVIDFGTTWTPTEPLRELFLHPLHTPLALACVAAVSAWALAAPGNG